MKRHFLLLLSLPFLLSIPSFSQSITSSPTTRTESDPSSWMSRIDDYAYLSQVSIPGSHDTGTGYGFDGWLESFGEQYARTQDLTITEQWNSGVRAFDLRPCVDGEELHINHGIMATKLTMREALTTICDLLDQNPTETAIVIMRHESDADGDDSQWGTMMSALLAEDRMQAHTVQYKPLLTLGEARGKLLLLSRDQYATYPTGGYIKNWSHSSSYSDQTKGTITAKGASGPCYVQDFYDCSASGAKDTKKRAINVLLQFYALRNKNNRLWCINHTSGYSQTTTFFGSEVSLSDGYRDNAATQNQSVIDFLTTNSGPTGIIMMDYAGTDHSGNYDVMGLTLTQAIIENNFKYEPKGAGINTIPTNEDSDETTSHLSSTSSSQPVYNIAGQRISQPAHGVYIIGRKKVIGVPSSY